MKLMGNLKKQVEKANSREEAKEIMEKAGLKLTDEELDIVAGGVAEPCLHLNPEADNGSPNQGLSLESNIIK